MLRPFRHDFPNVQARDGEGVAWRLQRDVRRIVGTYEEVGARSGQFLDVLPEHPSNSLVIARAIGVHHEMHCNPGQRDLGMQVRSEEPHALQACSSVAQCRAFEAMGENADMFHAGF